MRDDSDEPDQPAEQGDAPSPPAPYAGLIIRFSAPVRRVAHRIAAAQPGVDISHSIDLFACALKNAFVDGFPGALVQVTYLAASDEPRVRLFREQRFRPTERAQLVRQVFTVWERLLDDTDVWLTRQENT